MSGPQRMPDKITIVDYEAGNLTSVRLAVEKLARKGLITSSADEVRHATRLIFPGVGVAPHVMERLDLSGLGEALVEYARSGRPLLAICIGAQVVLNHSEEGDVDCLGLIDGRVRRLTLPPQAKIPHMGWNAVRPARPHPLFNGIEDGAQFYFVHSYYFEPSDRDTAIGLTDYFGEFTSAMAKQNLVATQFHPERSGRVGLRLLENFLDWTP